MEEYCCYCKTIMPVSGLERMFGTCKTCNRSYENYLSDPEQISPKYNTDGSEIILQPDRFQKLETQRLDLIKQIQKVIQTEVKEIEPVVELLVSINKLNADNFWFGDTKMRNVLQTGRIFIIHVLNEHEKLLQLGKRNSNLEAAITVLKNVRFITL